MNTDAIGLRIQRSPSFIHPILLLDGQYAAAVYVDHAEHYDQALAAR
jgi:hypothetical protein